MFLVKLFLFSELIFIFALSLMSLAFCSDSEQLSKTTMSISSLTGKTYSEDKTVFL